MSTRTMEVTTPGDREIRMTRTFDAPRALVFDAFVRPELVRRWLLGPDGWTMPVCEIDARAGGTIRYVWAAEDGREMAMSGRFTEVSPPLRTIHTERFDEDWTGGEAVVTTAFDEEGGRTTVTMTMLFGTTETRDAALRSGMESGVAVSYDRLDAILEGAV